MSGTTTNPTDALVSAMQDAVENLRLSANDPSDQIRLLVGLAAFQVAIPVSTTAIGQAVATCTAATAAILRRCALISLANACASYQPQSVSDAQTVLNLVIPLFDNEAEYASDAGDALTYQALRDVRSKVAADLQTRGASTPNIIQTYGGKPARVIAYRLYGDATQETQIVALNPQVAFTGYMPPILNVISP
jgi:prophage DNA circulation protein